MPYATSLRLSLGFMAVIHDGSCARAFSTSAQRMHLPPVARQRCSTVSSEASVLGIADEWFQSAPYTSAFCVTALKASLSDVLAQSNELRGSVVPKQPHSEESTEKMEHKILKEIVWQRTLAFLLYGGLYQGCAQYWIFNECFPAWFGDGHDFLTVASEVFMDQFILTPFLCLPIAYLFKVSLYRIAKALAASCDLRTSPVQAVVFRYSLFEGMQRYAADAQRDLLIKYWLLWGPVQCLTFGVVPQQWRIPVRRCASRA